MSAGILGNAINKAMTKLFGKSWKTSLFGLLALLAQAAGPVTTYLGTLKLEQTWLNAITLFFGVCFVISTKDRDATGGTR